MDFSLHLKQLLMESVRNAFPFESVSKKRWFPLWISTKLKETQISYNLFQAQHRQKIHTHYLVLVFSHSVKAVVSTGQFGDKKRSSWQFVLQLHCVLWESLFIPWNECFWFWAPEGGWAGAWGLSLARDVQLAALSRSLLHAMGTMVHLLFLRLYSNVIRFVGTYETSGSPH